MLSYPKLRIPSCSDHLLIVCSKQDASHFPHLPYNKTLTLFIKIMPLIKRTWDFLLKPFLWMKNSQMRYGKTVMLSGVSEWKGGMSLLSLYCHNFYQKF